MTNEIDLIRRLVATLSDLEAEHSEILHHRVFANEPCDCPLCDARQYLAWREPPKVEDPASDQLDLEEAIAKAK